MIKLNSTTVLNWAPYLAVVVTYLVAQIFKLNHMAPLPENIWDNVVLWDWARGFGNLDFHGFAVDSHHRLRWGNWGIPAIFIFLFSDDVLVYFLSTALPSILASLLFSYFVWRNIGVWQSALFLTLWYFDSELFRATFQLLPSGQSLLPASILLLLFTQAAKTAKESRDMPLWLSIGIALMTLWLYGVKETYMAFMPAIMWLMWRIGGFKSVQILMAVMLVGYAFETFVFHTITPEFPLLGRVYAVANSGSHVTIMMTHPHYVAEQTRYFDSGITMRWAVATGMSSIVYFTAFLCSILFIAQRQASEATRYAAEHLVAIFLLSFMVFTTFFILPTYPIRLGHGLVSRYLTIALPFSYIVILYFMTQQLRANGRLIKLAAMCIVPFYISPAINRFADYPDIGIAQIAEKYRHFGHNMNNYDCFRARSKSVLSNELDLIPYRYRSPELAKTIRDKVFDADDQGWFVIKPAESECQNTYSIGRVQTQRY